MLSNKPVQISLLEGKRQLVYVFSAFVQVSYVIANLRTRAKVLQVATAQSTIIRDGTYVVQESIDIGGFSLTPTKTGLLLAIIRKFELLHYAYVAPWETFRRAMTTNQLLSHEDNPFPRQFLFSSRFSTVDSAGSVWMLIKDYINHLCGETPTGLRMGGLAPTTNFAGLTVSPTDTQHKAAINAPYQ
jgi:hypothetical protein